MVIIKIALVGVAVAVMLAVAKQERLYARIGIVGSCEQIAPPGGDRTQWWSCSQGVLTGFPSLPADKCGYEATVGDRERWSCAEPLSGPPSF
jgi:hypothetical protein